MLFDRGDVISMADKMIRCSVPDDVMQGTLDRRENEVRQQASHLIHEIIRLGPMQDPGEALEALFAQGQCLCPQV